MSRTSCSARCTRSSARMRLLSMLFLILYSATVFLPSVVVQHLHCLPHPVEVAPVPVVSDVSRCPFPSGRWRVVVGHFRCAACPVTDVGDCAVEHERRTGDDEQVA